MENLNGLYRACCALRLNPIAYLVGLEEEDDNTTGEVLEVPTQGHTDGHTKGGEEGGETGGVDTQGADHSNNQQYLQQDADKTPDEGLNADLYLSALQKTGQKIVEELDEVMADEINDQRNENVLAGIQRPTDELTDDLVPVNIAFLKVLGKDFYL